MSLPQHVGPGHTKWHFGGHFPATMTNDLTFLDALRKARTATNPARPMSRMGEEGHPSILCRHKGTEVW